MKKLEDVEKAIENSTATFPYDICDSYRKESKLLNHIQESYANIEEDAENKNG